MTESTNTNWLGLAESKQGRKRINHNNAFRAVPGLAGSSKYVNTVMVSSFFSSNSSVIMKYQTKIKESRKLTEKKHKWTLKVNLALHHL